jgi:hypothetical protein
VCSAVLVQNDTHLRVGSGQLIGWAVFFTVAVAALAVNL